jgi:hypothetical protein
MRSPLLLSMLGLVIGFAEGTSAADPLAWLPADVNAVARLNVADVYKTPLAKKEGWLKKATESFINQDAFVPPGTKQTYMAAQLDLSDKLASTRQCGVLVPEGQVTLEKIVDYLPSGIETISGKPAAQFGQDGYVIDAGDGVWLTATHTNRQFIARWLKAGPTKDGKQLPSYLQQALTTKSNTAQLIVAIDLEDNFSKDQIADALKATDWFPSETVAETAADVLASAYGITLGINVDQDRTGIITVDFGKDAMVLKPVLEKIVGEVIQRVGATMGEFSDWKWTVKGSRVTGTGPVSPGSGRQLLSILEPPAMAHALSANSDEAKAEKMGRTSQKYCRSVQVLLDDLRKQLKDSRDNHALWMERYGRKIDDLPRLNVDPELLEFAGKVSSSLRYQGQTQRMANISAGTRIQESGANSPAWGGGYVGPYGGVYGWARSASPEIANTITAQANEQAKSVRFSEWKQIDDGLAAMRTKLTDRYQLEF